MKINPICTNYQYPKIKSIHTQPSFNGKHSAAKFLGGAFGTTGTLGAIGGSL